MTASQPNRVWRRFLIGWIVLILLLCSAPWWVESPRWGRVRLIPLMDVLRGPYWLLRDAFANVLLYMTCELYQVFSPVRYPTMTDILMNSIGAFSGASIAGKWLPPGPLHSERRKNA